MSSSTRHSFSVKKDENGQVSVSITLPTSWSEVTEDVYEYVLKLVAAGLTMDAIKSYLVFHAIPRRLLNHIPSVQLAVAMSTLDFLDVPPTEPRRPETLGKGKAIAASLQGLPFHDYLIIENLWQGFMDETSNIEELGEGDAIMESGAIRALLPLLYPGYREKKYEPWHAFVAVYWMQGLKSLFAAEFPNLFASTGQAPAEVNMRHVMETQIRALTDGDVTKRAAVLETETWAALTELDAKAREAEEISRATAKK